MKKVYLILVQEENGLSTFITKVFEKEEDATLYANHLNNCVKPSSKRHFTPVRVNMYTEHAYVRELVNL